MIEFFLFPTNMELAENIRIIFLSVSHSPKHHHWAISWSSRLGVERVRIAVYRTDCDPEAKRIQSQFSRVASHRWTVVLDLEQIPLNSFIFCESSSTALFCVMTDSLAAESNDGAHKVVASTDWLCYCEFNRIRQFGQCSTSRALRLRVICMRLWDLVLIQLSFVEEPR